MMYEIYRKVMLGREEILKAFIAKYGHQPEDIVQVINPYKGEAYYVSKRSWNEDPRNYKIPYPIKESRIW